jgi:hypothetical protein
MLAWCVVAKANPLNSRFLVMVMRIVFGLLVETVDGWLWVVALSVWCDDELVLDGMSWAVSAALEEGWRLVLLGERFLCSSRNRCRSSALVVGQSRRWKKFFVSQEVTGVSINTLPHPSRDKEIIRSTHISLSFAKHNTPVVV